VFSEKTCCVYFLGKKTVDVEGSSVLDKSFPARLRYTLTNKKLKSALFRTLNAGVVRDENGRLTRQELVESEEELSNATFSCQYLAGRRG
jgi:hypothetical protein